jgi:hypothetical protein
MKVRSHLRNLSAVPRTQEPFGLQRSSEHGGESFRNQNPVARLVASKFRSRVGRHVYSIFEYVIPVVPTAMSCCVSGCANLSSTGEIRCVEHERYCPEAFVVGNCSSRVASINLHFGWKFAFILYIFIMLPVVSSNSSCNIINVYMTLQVKCSNK